jgi:hypothetical protein
MRKRGIVVVVTLVVLAGVPGWAETPVEQRLRALEQQLREAQQEIKRLRNQVEQQRAIGQATQKQVEEGKFAQEEQAKKVETAKAEAKKKGELPIRSSYAFGKGFKVQTEDDRYELNVYNRLQLRYTFTDQEDDKKEDTSTFRVRRMRTIFEGHFYDPSLLYKVQVEWASKPELKDAYLWWKPRPYAGLQVGQWKVPFNRQQITSSGALQLVDRSITDDFFTLERDVGASLTGNWFGEKHDLVEWNAGIFNGNGFNRTNNDNSDHLGVARLLFMPLGKFDYYVESDVNNTPDPRFGIGGAGAYNSQADSTATEKARVFEGGRLGTFFGDDIKGRFDVAQATVDAHFKWRGLSVLGDYFWAEADPNAGLSKSAQGYNFQTGYFVLPKRLEAAFRYAWIDRDLDGDHGLREIGGAIGYFFLAHNLKIQADVRRLSDEGPGRDDLDTMEYRAQVQAIF